jgi:hypothetical protein
VAALSLQLASRLELRTAIAELLPTRDPAVVALERTRDRIGDLSLLLFGIHSPDRAANLRYAEALTLRLGELPPNVCELATYHIRELRQFLERNRWLYVPEEDLVEIRDRLRSELTRRKNPFAADLGVDDDRHPAAGGALAPALARHALLEDRFPGGSFARGDYVWVATLPSGGFQEENVGDGILRAVREFVAANPPSRYHPDMRVVPAGPVMAALHTREAVERDILAVTVICVLLVSASIALYFRSKRAVLVVVAPAVLGTLAAFAVAELAFGNLNSSTAFLGSIILGNGINYAIVLAARYNEHRRQGEPPRAAMTAAVSGVWRGTLAAALSAAAAYASLLLTGFRGFSQFGLMGAAGALLCWAATFAVMPAMMILADRQGRSAVAQRPARRRAWMMLGQLVTRRAGALTLGALLVTLLAVVGIRHFLDRPFEYDFRRLSTDLEQDQDYQRADHNLDQLFSHWHSPTVLLADRRDQVEPMRQAILRQDQQRQDQRRQAGAAATPFIGQVVTIYDVLPGTPERQQRKLALLEQIRKLVDDPAVSLLDEADRRLIAENAPPHSLRELRPEDLPAIVRRPFTERDGSVGRVLLAYHNSPQVSRWNGHDLLGIAGVLQRLTLADGTVIESSGPPMIFGAMLRSVLRDGPLATVFSLAAVLLIISVLLRPLRAALLATGALLAGVLWMLGVAGLLGVRINFLNFIALPITFGIGAEYAVNIVARLRQEGGHISRAILGTGSAVVLCSWTTIVGYGSLLAARSQALRSFGAMAILGEVACLAAAVIALPALLGWIAHHRGRRRSAGEPAARLFAGG